MIKYLKDELKHIPTILVLIVLCYGIITLADNYLFNSSDVKYNNTTSGIQSGDVQGAIDELYACASNYAAYNNRLTNAENTMNTLESALNPAISTIPIVCGDTQSDLILLTNKPPLAVSGIVKKIIPMGGGDGYDVNITLIFGAGGDTYFINETYVPYVRQYPTLAMVEWTY